MKKIISLVCVLALALSLAACGKFTCENCGEKKSGKQYTVEVFGEKAKVCKDCKAEIDALLGELEDLEDLDLEDVDLSDFE